MGDAPTLEERADSEDGIARVFRGHLKAVTACAYSADGSRILSASRDNTLRERDRSSGQELRRFEGHSNRVTACAYSPDGSRILSASSDNTLRIWSRNDSRCLDIVYRAAAFDCIATTRGHLTAGDALGNVWMLECDWLD